MNRKTNIFYNLSDADRKFLTFSNYTEALTGNFLATDKKLFPSTFICVDIPMNNLLKFKNELLYYYENKLAVLRDFYISQNELSENYIYPLSYLLDLVFAFDGEIVYVGDITENDYNGTYTDTICIIEQNTEFKTYHVVHEESLDGAVSVNIGDYLHGWESYVNDNNDSRIDILDVNNQKLSLKMNQDENNTSGTIRHDKDHKHEICLNGYGKYEFQKMDDYKGDGYSSSIESDSMITKTSIKFNCIIPLFDITDMNYNISNSLSTTNATSINAKSINKNIPFGIWLNDECIELKSDTTTHYMPSWSLMITSQFKPFPYSKQITDTIEHKNALSFNTFASILGEQNKITHLIQTLSNDITSINIRLKALEDVVHNSNQYEHSYNDIRKEMVNIEQNVNVKLDNIKKELEEKYEALKWQASI